MTQDLQPTSATPAPRYAGTRVQRVEDSRLLTGHGSFVDDISRPGMLHACFVRSPFARARINGIDASAALALPGVHAVFTAADLNPDVREAWHAVAGKDVPDTPRPPLANGEAKFVGDPVALVVAENRYLAEDALELVDVDYEPLPAVVDFRQAQSAEVLVHDGYPNNVAGGMGGVRPDENVFATSPYVVAEHLYQQIHLPVPIETRGLVVEWVAASGELTVWASTQTPHELRAFCARLLGIAAQRVRVIARDTGGGFGQKVVPMREDMCIMLAARKVPAALKWIEDRRENLMSAGQARHVDGRARMAFDDEGKNRGRRHRLRPGHRGLSDAVPGVDHRGHRHVLPWAVPGAQGQLQLQGGVLQHRRVGGLPRSMAVRNPRARNTFRHRRAQDEYRSRRAAPVQSAAR